MVNNVRESKPCGCVTSHRAWSSLPDRRNKQTLLTRGHWTRAIITQEMGYFMGIYHSNHGGMPSGSQILGGEFGQIASKYHHFNSQYSRTAWLNCYQNTKTFWTSVQQKWWKWWLCQPEFENCTQITTTNMPTLSSFTGRMWQPALVSQDELRRSGGLVFTGSSRPADKSKCSWPLYYDTITAATARGWTERLDSSKPTTWQTVAAAGVSV